MDIVMNSIRRDVYCEYKEKFRNKANEFCLYCEVCYFMYSVCFHSFSQKKKTETLLTVEKQTHFSTFSRSQLHKKSSLKRGRKRGLKKKQTKNCRKPKPFSAFFCNSSRFILLIFRHNRFNLLLDISFFYSTACSSFYNFIEVSSRILMKFVSIFAKE